MAGRGIVHDLDGSKKEASNFDTGIEFTRSTEDRIVGPRASIPKVTCEDGAEREEDTTLVSSGSGPIAAHTS